MTKLIRIALIGLLALLSAIVAAETPDECAARLDQSIAIRTYEEAADWWAQVQRECAPEPSAGAEYNPDKPFAGIYGWSGDFVFCVVSPTLNVRKSAGGPVMGRLDKGTLFTVDLASQELVDGFVWAEHDKGWSALFRYPVSDNIDEFTSPQACPSPTLVPSPTPVATATRVSRTTSTRSSATYPIIQIGRPKTFQLSGADCTIVASSGTSIEAGKLYLAVGRIGWLKDEFRVDLFAPGGRSALAYVESEVDGDDIGVFSHQLYSPRSTGEALGRYTVRVATYTEEEKYDLRVTSKATFNIAVACE